MLGGYKEYIYKFSMCGDCHQEAQKVTVGSSCAVLSDKGLFTVEIHVKTLWDPDFIIFNVNTQRSSHSNADLHTAQN